MIYNSFLYVILFPILFLLSYAVKGSAIKKYLLLAVSYLLYAYYNQSLVIILFLVTLISYGAARVLSTKDETTNETKGEARQARPLEIPVSAKAHRPLQADAHPARLHGIATAIVPKRLGLSRLQEDLPRGEDTLSQSLLRQPIHPASGSFPQRQPPKPRGRRHVFEGNQGGNQQ